MNNLKYILLIAMLTMACSGNKESSQTVKQTAIATDHTKVVLTPEQVSAIKLKFGSIESRTLTDVIKANGYMDAPPQNKAVISPMITGYVRKVNFLVGDHVRKGQVMVELESMDFIDMQQQYIELNTRVAFLKEEFDRQKLLRKQDAVSRKTFLTAEVEYKSASSLLQGLKSKLQILGVDFKKLDQDNIESRILLKAPISGSVKKFNTIIGKQVDPSEELFEIVNPDHLHLELSVYEKDVLKVDEKQKVWFKIPSMPNSIFEGEVFLVGQDMSEDKRSINVHVHIDEEQANFAVGMYANASIVVEENPSYTLPITAVVVDGTDKFVFIKTITSQGEMAFNKISVITGIESDGLVALTSLNGLALEDDIVIDGAFYLLNAFAGEE